MLYARRVDALHFFLWRTSALNIKHKTKPDRFRPFRLRVDGALFPIGHSDRRHLEFSVLLIFFRSKTGNYRTTGTLLPLFRAVSGVSSLNANELLPNELSD